MPLRTNDPVPPQVDSNLAPWRQALLAKYRQGVIVLQNVGIAPRSITSRVGLLLLCLLVITSMIQTSIAVFFWKDFVDRVLQENNVDLANSIAVELAPKLAAGDTDAVKEAIRLFSLVGQEEYLIYLLNSDGDPIYPSGIRVDTEVLRSYLEGDPKFPVLNTDPRDGHKKVFSVSPVMIGGRPGYLYVVLPYGGGSLLSMKLYLEWALGFNIVSFLVAMVVVFVLAWRMITLVTLPLRKLSAAVDAFRHGRYEERLTMNWDDELGDLATTFNKMAETIEHNVAELTRIELSRRELVAHISHDLRGPVASALAAIDVVSGKKSDAGEKERAKFLEAARGSITRVQQLIADLFELSKLELMAAPRTSDLLSFPDLVNDLVIQSQSRARAKEVNVSVELPAEAVQVHGDSALLERAVNNLLENAIRYTPANHAVSVVVTEHEGAVGIKIIDQGPGIDESELARLGQPFYRVFETLSQFEGSGLGLAIVKRILALHGSALEISSKVGTGSTFGFILPAARSRVLGDDSTSRGDLGAEDQDGNNHGAPAQ